MTSSRKGVGILKFVTCLRILLSFFLFFFLKKNSRSVVHFCGWGEWRVSQNWSFLLNVVNVRPLKRLFWIFKENSYYAKKGVFWCPKSLFLIFSRNLFIRFFWNCTWYQALEIMQNWLFWSLKKTLYYG